MSKIVCVAQTVEELRFILLKSRQSLTVIPLELKVQLYCIENKINYLNPIKYINNTFYKNALVKSEKLIKSLKYLNLDHCCNQIEANAILRYRLYSILFLEELITKIDQQIKIEKIFLSGWDKYAGQYSKKNYFVSKILKTIFKKKKIVILSNDKFSLNQKLEIYKYKIKGIKKNNNQKYILLSNLGYNFFRIVKNLKIKNTFFLTEYDENIGFIKQIIYKLLKVKFFKFEKQDIKAKKFKIPRIIAKYNNKIILGLLSDRINQEQYNIIQSILKTQAVDDFFSDHKICSVFSNMSRGIYGYYLEAASKKKINSICIPHGTLPQHFNKYDKIYKTIIAEAVLSNKSKVIALQSKIANEFFKKTYKNFKNKKINSGNLIFSENLKPKYKKINGKILYAVTLRNFQNLQFLGVEMFYEFLSNLNFLQNFSKKKNISVIVKLHPAAKDCINELRRIYPSLKFTNKKIDKLLKSVDFTISFSSTSIEDSLYSFKPVILLDQWKRYQHCRSEKNLNKRNEAIYYLNKKEEVAKCMETIYKSNNVNFKKYIYLGKTKNNITKFNNLIKN